MALVSLEARIENVFPLCGEHLVGTFLCGGGDGPMARVSQSLARTTALVASLLGTASLSSLLALRRSVGVEIAGKAEILPVLVRTLGLGVPVEGRASITAAARIAWLQPTEGVDLTLPPLGDGDSLALIPTDEASWLLIATDEESASMTPSEEEEWQLVPTGQR